MQFLIGLLIGVALYIGAYFLITAIKKKKKNKNNSDINENKLK